jgi:hypothetical protein
MPINDRNCWNFEVNDKVLLKVSPWKGTIRFGKNRKIESMIHRAIQDNRKNKSGSLHVGIA